MQLSYPHLKQPTLKLLLAEKHHLPISSLPLTEVYQHPTPMQSSVEEHQHPTPMQSSVEEHQHSTPVQTSVEERQQPTRVLLLAEWHQHPILAQLSIVDYQYSTLPLPPDEHSPPILMILISGGDGTRNFRTVQPSQATHPPSYHSILNSQHVSPTRYLVSNP